MAFGGKWAIDKKPSRYALFPKGRFVAIDPGTKDGDMTAKVEGKINKDGTIEIESVTIKKE